MEELLKKLNRNNDDIVFEEIINKVQKQLFIIAKARLRDDSLAEDALQETFISLYLNINKIKDEKKLKAWLTKILINKCNDIMRKNKIYSFKCDYNILENNLYSNNQYDDLNNHIDIFRIINLLNVEDTTTVSEDGTGEEKTDTFGNFLNDYGFTPCVVIISEGRQLAGFFGTTSLISFEDWLSSYGI